MAQCKLNKITDICVKWNSEKIESCEAMLQVKKIIDMKESEMPPCTCAQEKDRSLVKPIAASPKKQECSMKHGAASLAKADEESESESEDESQSQSEYESQMQSENESCSEEECHSPGPPTINSFFNFMRKMRQKACFKNTVNEVAQEAAEKWNRMTDCEKAPYVLEAYGVSEKMKSMKRKNSETSCEPKAKVKKMEEPKGYA